MRERVCALEPRADCILLTTLRTHEDILPACESGIVEPLPKIDPRMLEIAGRIVEQQEGKFDPATFTDRYADAVRELIARKKKGQKVAVAPPAGRSDGKVINLMEALRRSLAGPDGGAREGAIFRPQKGKGGTPVPEKGRIGPGASVPMVIA